MTQLCTACGLCCDGSLFGRVPIGTDEVPVARKHRLAVVASGRAFEQPCSALSDARTCAIYEERPRACRVFECVLYTQEEIPIAERLAIVARARELLSRLASLSDAELGELRDRMEQDFARAPGVP